MQMTIGTNVQATYGQNIEINCGPKKLELNNTADPVSIILCDVMGAAIVVFVLAYHGLESDHDRTKLALGFQVLIEVLILTLVAVASTKEQLKNKDDQDRRKALFKYDIEFAAWIKKVLASKEFAEGVGTTFAALVALAIAAYLVEEKKTVQIPVEKPTPTGPYE